MNQEQAFVESVKMMCEAAGVDPTHVQQITWRPFEAVITVYETDKNDNHYLECHEEGYHREHEGCCEVATRDIRMPGLPVA